MGVLDMAGSDRGCRGAVRNRRAGPAGSGAERKKARASSGVATSSLVTNAPNGAFQKASRTGGPSYGPT